MIKTGIRSSVRSRRGRGSKRNDDEIGNNPATPEGFRGRLRDTHRHFSYGASRHLAGHRRAPGCQIHPARQGSAKLIVAACNTAAPFSSITASSTPIRPTSTPSSRPTTFAFCARNTSIPSRTRSIGSRCSSAMNKTPTAMGFFGQPLAGGNTINCRHRPGRRQRRRWQRRWNCNAWWDGFSWYWFHEQSRARAQPVRGSPTGNSGGAGSASSTTNSTTSPGTNSSGGPGSSNGSDQSGQTFGGGGIIGFSPASPRKSILIYKKKEHYNEWEFTYDPISDMQTVSGGNAGSSGLPGSNGQPGGNGTNTPASSSPFGGANSGPTNTPSPSPNTPQQ